MLTLIAAIAENDVLGFNGDMPWARIPEDMRRFQRLTFDHKCIVGRKTYESLLAKRKDGQGDPLPRRRLLVVSGHGVMLRNDLTNVEWHLSPELAFYSVPPNEHLFCIGGGEVYKALLGYADYMQLTYIERDYKGDAFFPAANTWGGWKIISRTETVPADGDIPPYHFETWRRT